MDNVLQNERILAAVDKIQAHILFKRAPLVRAFLSYVVNETLQGREANIIAYSIGVDALGKSADFDPQVDPSVRVLAKRVRDTLTKYYKDESDYDVHILLKPGSYVPRFSYVVRVEKQDSISTNDSISALEKPSSKRIPWTSPVLTFKSED